MPDTVDAALDATVSAEGHALEGQAVVDALDGALHGEGDALGAALNGGNEVVDVTLPGCLGVRVSGMFLFVCFGSGCALLLWIIDEGKSICGCVRVFVRFITRLTKQLGFIIS